MKLILNAATMFANQLPLPAIMIEIHKMYVVTATLALETKKKEIAAMVCVQIQEKMEYALEKSVLQMMLNVETQTSNVVLMKDYVDILIILVPVKKTRTVGQGKNVVMVNAKTVQNNVQIVAAMITIVQLVNPVVGWNQQMVWNFITATQTNVLLHAQIIKIAIIKTLTAVKANVALVLAHIKLLHAEAPAISAKQH